MQKIYILTGNDEWLTDVVINQLQHKYEVILIKVYSKSFNIFKNIKILILIGFIDFLKILLIQFKKKDYKIIKVKKKNLNNFLKKINSNKIFLINYPFKIKQNFKNLYNCHPSLLPNYKGLLPIQRSIFDAITKKKKKFGSTIHKVNKFFDSGKIIWNKSIKLDINNHLSFKKIYEDFYGTFYFGIKYVCSSKKRRFIKPKIIRSSKLTMNIFEIILLKIKTL